MITRIVKTGNIHSIHIPETILQQSGLEDEVELEVRNKQLIIKPKRDVREGWNDAFCLMAEAGDDQLLDDAGTLSQSRWDEDEWKW